MRSTFVLLILSSSMLSGCVGMETEVPHVPQGTQLGPARVNETSGATEFLRPQWSVGRWWDVRVSVDNGYGFLTDLAGKLVVSSADASGFRVGADSPGIGTFDEYFDHFHIGAFDVGLNATIHGSQFRPYDWPLAPGRTWRTEYRMLNEYHELRPSNVSLTATTFEEEPASQRLRVQGESETGHSLDYDFSATSGWMTYFRMLNKTTGRVLFALDFTDTGLGYIGDVHHVRSKVVYERFVISPPWTVEIAGMPPAERVQVPPGHDWVEVIGFLFTYPLRGAGGGSSAFVVQRPDHTIDRQTHRHAGETFAGNFTRIVVETTAAGTWTVAMHAAGTAGAVVVLRGFNDEIVAL